MFLNVIVERKSQISQNPVGKHVIFYDYVWTNLDLIFGPFLFSFFPDSPSGEHEWGRGFVSKCSPSPCPPGSSQDTINGAARYLALGETAGSEMRSPMLVFALFYEFVLVLM